MAAAVIAIAGLPSLCRISLPPASCIVSKCRRSVPAVNTRRHISFSATSSFGICSIGTVLSSCKVVQCSAVDDSATTTSIADVAESWVPVIPFSALPKGERRLIRQDGDTVLLLWYRDNVYALENTSPAEGAYSEGLLNARLTSDGCIVCPSTETTFDLKTGAIKEWYPTNPILAFLTRPTRELDIYPVKTDSQYVYINTKKGKTGQSAEIVFGGQMQAGRTATDVNVDEVRMVVEDNEGVFGFTPYTELVNGRAAMLGFTVVILSELVSGKGFLKGLGFLDFLYKFL